MKILLVGEYSRLHNSLKEGLTALGHEVCLVATGDFFKGYPADIRLKRKYDSGWSRKLKVGLYKLFRTDITSFSLLRQVQKHYRNLKGFDIIQLINETPLGMQPKHEKRLLTFLKKHNKKLFLLSCGTDYISVQYARDKKKLRYSILTPYFEGRVPKKAMPALRYIEPEYKAHHQFVYANTEGVIASDLDYHLPLEGHPHYLGLIPNPVNIDILTMQDIHISDKICMFLGINSMNELKKGCDFFEKALDIIGKKYDLRVEITITRDLPYDEYIKRYDRAHILLDQVYAYDQGYNALEAMARGKVVFTGAEQEFLDQYGLTEDKACINALPDVNELVKKLSWLIENPEEISRIGENARRFIEKEHHYIKVAEKYLDVWVSSSSKSHLALGETKHK